MDAVTLTAIVGMVMALAAVANSIFAGRASVKHQEFDHLAETVRLLQSENTRMRQRIVEMETERADMRLRISELEVERNSSRDRIETLEGLVADQATQISELEKQLRDLGLEPITQKGKR